MKPFSHHRWYSVQLIVVALLLVGCGRPGNGVGVRPTAPSLSTMQLAAPAPLPALATTSPNTVVPSPRTSTLPQKDRAQFLASDVISSDSNRFIRGASMQNDGRVALIPWTMLTANTPTDPPSAIVTFDGKMALRVELFDSRIAEQDGAGIVGVDFQIVEEASGETRFVNRDVVAPYCLFGGDEPLCAPFDFAENGWRWPSGDPLFNGRYMVQITIATTSGDGTKWAWPFAIVGATDRANAGVIMTTPLAQQATDFSGLWYTNFAEITFHQEGAAVTGTYARYGQQETLQLAGTVTDMQLDGYFGGDPVDRFHLLLSDNRQYFTGAWFRRGDGATHDWCGVRIGAGALPAGCGFSGEWLLTGATVASEQAVAHLEQIGPNVSGVVLGAVGPLTTTVQVNVNGTVLANLGEAGIFPFYSASGLYTLNGVSYPMRWDLLDFNSEHFGGCLVLGETVLPWCGRRSDGTPSACPLAVNCP